MEQAEQDAKSIVIKAQGEAKAAELLGIAMQKSPAFLQLRRVEAAQEIATILSRSRNRIFLESDTLLLNLTSNMDQNLNRESKTAAAA